MSHVTRLVFVSLNMNILGFSRQRKSIAAKRSVFPVSSMYSAIVQVRSLSFSHSSYVRMTSIRAEPCQSQYSKKRNRLHILDRPDVDCVYPTNTAREENEIQVADSSISDAIYNMYAHPIHLA